MSAFSNICTIPASAPFAETIAQTLVERTGSDPFALSAATIYLPTRRAVRTLADTFARVLGGAALLPDIKPLGDVDEDDVLFDTSPDGFVLPPAIAPLRRRLLLATLIQRWDERQRDGNLTFAQAVGLAASLSRLMDEVETQGVDLAKLASLAPAAMATHWAEVRDFLSIVRDEWPGVLAAECAINPSAHRNQTLAALADRLTREPPPGPVIAAGSTGSIPATAVLMKAIAALPNGMIVLPGLDRTLDEKSWRTLEAGHPQFGMMHLLRHLEVKRDDVRDLVRGRNPGREEFLSEALRPAPTTDAWRARAEKRDLLFAAALDGVSLLEATNPAEEATAIALALREMLERPASTAALVTPDRSLARRVAAEMGRWGIAIDDSAGRPLSQTPPGAFLCLLADAADAQFAPVPLLALLKHPLAALGSEPARFRYRVRQLDRLCLRGPRPDAGLKGIADAIQRAHDDSRQFEQEILKEVAQWFERVERCLQPLADAFAPRTVGLADLLKAQVATAERLAGDHESTGATRLWRGTDGEAAAKLVAALHEAAEGLPQVETSSFAPLFHALADERSVRLPYGAHPRLSILGPLEARLQSFDLVVLGGLNEGTWPSAAPIDPWFSRPMRTRLGLEQPERQIGLAAHDFATLVAAERVILTRSLKVEGTPTIASRWLQRVQQLAAGVDAKFENAARYSQLAARLDEAPAIVPQEAPQPRPPRSARPRSLSVTEIETWLRDPYAIYARRVLKLEKLDPLDSVVGALERGTVVHSALEAFLKQFADALPDDAERHLIATADAMFARERIPKATLALWRPRFVSAAQWFIGLERERRAEIVRSFAEIRGTRAFDGDFTLRGRADRIDQKTNGRAVVIDYKTGRPPSVRQVETMISPQLPLEAAMLQTGGFEEVDPMPVDELLYIQFSGGRIPGKAVPIAGAEKLAADAVVRLLKRIAEFNDENTPYLSRLIPFRANIPGDYDHLARVREWSLSGWAEDEE